MDPRHASGSEMPRSGQLTCNYFSHGRPTGKRRARGFCGAGAWIHLLDPCCCCGERDGLASLLEGPEYQASIVMAPPSEPLPFFAVLSSFAGAALEALEAAGFPFGVFAMLLFLRETGGDETPTLSGETYFSFI